MHFFFVVFFEITAFKETQTVLLTALNFIFFSITNVKIVDGTASGLHCTITPTFDSKNGKIISCTIRDSSSNGTWLNDRQLIKDEETKLWYGDIISLCQSHLNTDEEHVASFEFKKGLIEVEELRETFCYDTPQKKSASGVAY